MFYSILKLFCLALLRNVFFIVIWSYNLSHDYGNDTNNQVKIKWNLKKKFNKLIILVKNVCVKEQNKLNTKGYGAPFSFFKKKADLSLALFESQIVRKNLKSALILVMPFMKR